MLDSIFKLFNIKIVILWTNTFGEFILGNEVFIRKLQLGLLSNKDKYILLGTNNPKEIANHTIYNLYKDYYKTTKNIYLLENSFVLKYFKNILKQKNKKRKYLVAFIQSSNEYDIFLNTKSTIQFSQNQKRDGNETLNKLGIYKKYVCIYARDSQYLKNKVTFDTSYHDYRNADIDTYSLAIEYLIHKGYQVVRIGNIVSKPCSYKDKDFIDYPYTDFVSDFMDIFLISQCEFIIGTTSGLVDLSNAFNKPRLGVNNLPIGYASYSSKDDIYIPKKLKFGENYLGLQTYLDLIDCSNFNHFRTESYLEFNLEIEDNTQEEILNVVKEYLGEYILDESDKLNQEVYQRIHLKSKDFGGVKTKIGSDFLKNNQWFIKG